MRFRLGLIALFALGLGLIGWALFLRESDEEAIRRRLDTISRAVRIDPQEGVVARALKVRGGFDASFDKTARVKAPELGEQLDRDLLVGVATQASQRWTSGELGWSDVVVVVREGGTAHVDATAQLTGTTRGEPGDEERKVSIDLRKHEGEWIVTSLVVERPGEAEEEATE